VALTLRDPIHGTVTLDEWARPLVDHPVMQRLRRIQQLGTAHLVYPGAHHRRFEHSLGAYHLAGRLAQAAGLDADQSRTVRAAALLHDVGHGPFSHAFEDLLRDQDRRHEETSLDLIRWGPLADLLRQGGLDPVAVGDAVVGKGPLAPIVSGALDADRMDYLVRDAHYTGLPSNVDPDRLVSVLERDDQHGLVLQESGIIAAEALLTMRFLMYGAVYMHHTVRSSQAMLVAAVRHHVADGHAKIAELERETDDALLWRMRSAGGRAAELVARLDERKLFKRAYEGRADQAESKPVLALQKDAKARRQAETEIAEAARVAPHLVLVDVPKPPKFRELGVHVRTADGLRTLAQLSRLVAVLQEARLDHWRFWAFAPKGDREAVGKAAQRFFAT
jgi:HD superfamily phosphohydrolase